ncbi:hypothetical protein MLD38_025189 [Melastoma candidum]|uniref:Uncharacterized protein n=1 Tax=Melastoma candidum TaxID=119954 RepID=A0ACB9NW67_9MYRT|nr:hypothetical protein MLD38_025189 [Melastoma candidum]
MSCAPHRTPTRNIVDITSHSSLPLSFLLTSTRTRGQARTLPRDLPKLHGARFRFRDRTSCSGCVGGPSTAAAGAGEGSSGAAAPLSRYESQKRRDWNTFLQYLKNHKPPLILPRCSGAHVIEFLKYLDQFGKTKGSLDTLIGQLRAGYEENRGRAESNPFGDKAVKIFLREVREGKGKAKGIAYGKKRKRKRRRPEVGKGSSRGEGSTGEGGGSVGGATP